MIKTINGDLIELAINGDFDIIIHGCNCFHAMGAGIAKQIAKQFPISKIADKSTTYADINKLGTWSFVTTPIGDTLHILTIVNAYTQFRPGPNAEYAAIEKFLIDFYPHIANQNLRIGIPQIGCGIGGLEIEHVTKLIDQMWKDLDITLVIYDV